MNVNILILSLFIIIIGCSNSNKINNYNEVDMKKELSYEEAQQFAIKLANDEYSKKELKNPYTGEKIPTVVINYLAGKKDGNRWVFGKFAPAGPEVTVSFDLDGRNPEIKAEYSWQ